MPKVSKERKKAYTFKFGSHINNQLSNLANHFKMDRTEVLEYMISVWSTMWVESEEKKNNGE